MSLRLVTGYPRVDPPTTPGVPAASWVTSTPKNDVQSLSWRTCNRGSTSSWRVTKTYMRPVTGVARIAAGTAISNRACATTGNGKGKATATMRATVAKRNGRFLKKVA